MKSCVKCDSSHLEKDAKQKERGVLIVIKKAVLNKGMTYCGTVKMVRAVNDYGNKYSTNENDERSESGRSMYPKDESCGESKSNINEASVRLCTCNFSYYNEENQ